MDGIARTPETQRQYLETIRVKAADLNHIVSQLFLFSEMELGEEPEKSCEIRLDEAVEDIVSTLREEYQDKGLSIVIETEPFTMNADPIQIRRIFTNIMENRLKYKKKEQGRLFITLRRTENGCRLSIFVDGEETELKNKEYELILFLMLNVDMVFDRETLYERVWGIEAMGDNATVAVHINRLREKIEKDPANPQYIETVWGAGYRFRG